MKNLIFILPMLLSFVAGCTANSMSASEVTQPDGSSKCDLSISNVPLSKVVETIAGRIGKTVNFASDVDSRMKITAKVEADSWESCLKLISRQYGLEVTYDEATGVYEITNRSDE